MIILTDEEMREVTALLLYSYKALMIKDAIYTDCTSPCLQARLENILTKGFGVYMREKAINGTSDLIK